ncbi:MAG: NAD(P)H-dependent oxidoreductase [Euryarchaeota archaeon]|nr:NAD(P)H-dependent oxidoreductase [Euryarchaeota archaeon]
MKTAIIYYSRTGNTRHVVQLLENKMKEKKVDVDIIEIQTAKKPGFFKAGSAGMKEKELPITNTCVDLQPYDMFLVGSPIWAGKPAPLIKTFFNSVKNAKGKKASVFITCSGKPEEHVKEIMKNWMEPTGVQVSDVFLGLQMKKGKIITGENNITMFIETAIRP